VGLLILAVVRFPDSKYWDVTVQLDPGNKLLLFTDGITEATNTRDEEYGEARLRQRLNSESSSEAAAMHRKMMQEVSDFCLGNFADDATLVLISFLPIGEIPCDRIMEQSLRARNSCGLSNPAGIFCPVPASPSLRCRFAPVHAGVRCEWCQQNQ
jgi:hypothetical protein